jgi:FKBP-type peptidyl-prolyl cis-trans isomerase (trigger factor)
LGWKSAKIVRISAFLPDDHAAPKMRGAPVVFDVTLRRIQERNLPDWEELPTLESFEGSLAEFKVRPQ